MVSSCTADHCCNHVRHFGDVTSREDYTMDFEVKTGVPIPEVVLGKKRGKGKWQVLLASMSGGDCVDLPEANYNSMYVAASRLGITLMSRREADGLADGFVRIWRGFSQDD